MVAEPPLLPPERNAAFVAVQAAMMAIIHDNPDAARACLEIALDELRIWNKERPRSLPVGVPR
jgi:hypothetical protein